MTQGTKASKSKEYEKEVKRSSQRIMKEIQLEDEPLQPTTCRIKKVTELEEDVQIRSTHRQDIRKSRIPIQTWQKKLRSNCQSNL